MKWTRVQAAGAPCPRWGHSAVGWGSLVVVFGGFKDSSTRLDDVFVFDTAASKWSAPPCAAATEQRAMQVSAVGGAEDGEGKAGDDEQERDVNDGEEEGAATTAGKGSFEVPSARGEHGAALVGDAMYVFGGYGGVGVARRDLNDLYCLDLNTWAWQRRRCRGAAPSPRSGHALCAVMSSLLVFGGSSATQQFCDMHVLDLSSMAWKESSVTLGVPRWSMGAIAVEAIPRWKVFLFGGAVGDLEEMRKVQGDYSSSFQVCEAGVGPRCCHPTSPHPRPRPHRC